MKSRQRITDSAQNLLELLPDQIITIDSHTAGEPTRLIVGGVPPIPGQTVADKRLYLIREWDHIRLQLTREPRGHRDMIAALVTEPVSEGADFGLIYMDARRYPYLCGHATIGAVTTLIEARAVEAVEPETLVTIDTPSGPATATAHVQGGRVESVTIQLAPSFVYGEHQPLDVPGLGRIEVDTVCVGGFFAMVSADQIGLELKPENSKRLIELGMTIIDEANVQGGRVESVTLPLAPSFVYGEHQPLDVPGLGRIEVDTVCVGGFFAMVSADQIGLELKPENSKRLIELGMTIIDEANAQLTVRHPTRPEVTTVDVTEFYTAGSADDNHGPKGSSAVIYGASHIDRSPCGTGTSAKMALLHHRGQLALNRTYVNTGILGTTFEGRLVAETMVGDLPAVVPQVRGSAHITGVHRFAVTPDDPFPEGFLI